MNVRLPVDQIRACEHRICSLCRARGYLNERRLQYPDFSKTMCHSESERLHYWPSKLVGLTKSAESLVVGQ